MKRLSTLLAITLVLAGCASPVFLVNPQTGQGVQCAANTVWGGVGGGIATGIGAHIQVQRCAEQMEALGYVRADNVPEARKQISAKDVLAFQETARKALVQARQIYPDRPYCRVAVVLWPDNTIVRVEPIAMRAGIRAGDRIVAVNGERHDDRLV